MRSAAPPTYPTLSSLSQFEAALAPHRDALYNTLVAESGCGPFDGGCLAYASALQSVIGGRIVVLVRREGIADHAAVELGDLLFDFNGPLPARKFITRYEASEHRKIDRYRALGSGDLPDAYRGAALQTALASILTTALKPLLWINVDGTERLTLNNRGAPIAETEDGLRAFWRWFGDSQAVDDTGRPLVYFHGSAQAGFTTFDPDRGARTRGLFFTDSAQLARGYAKGAMTPEPVYTPDQLLADPDLIDGLEINAGVVIKRAHQTFFFDSAEAAHESGELDEGEIPQPGYQLLHDEEVIGDRSAILDHLHDIRTRAPGVYEVYLNVRDLFIVDWQGNNWDQGPTEKVWQLVNPGGELVDWAYSPEEAAASVAKDPSLSVREEDRRDFESTDDVVRHGGTGFDGVLIQNVWDTGPTGHADSGNVLVVYQPRNIKSVRNTGMFDPGNADIRFSLSDDEDADTHPPTERPRG